MIQNKKGEIVMEIFRIIIRMYPIFADADAFLRTGIFDIRRPDNNRLVLPHHLLRVIGDAMRGRDRAIRCD